MTNKFIKTHCVLACVDVNIDLRDSVKSRPAKGQRTLDRVMTTIVDHL